MSVQNQIRFLCGLIWINGFKFMILFLLRFPGVLRHSLLFPRSSDKAYQSALWICCTDPDPNLILRASKSLLFNSVNQMSRMHGTLLSTEHQAKSLQLVTLLR